MGRMSWNNLFCEHRERKSNTRIEPYRNIFDMDYDRIVYSSSLRRLQDKAQVFPLQENDFTRTRLTHSLEVSAIGRSLGAHIGYKLKEKGEFDDVQERKLASLLAVVGLVHDLGNPPFGHYGEDIIKEWFIRSEKIGQVFKGENELKDYLYFDGNAQTIRILTRLQFLNDRYGINFSYGTLGTLLKYPWLSSDKRAKEINKFGCFRSEEKLFEDIMEKTGIINRHPATYLLEAADDIAYLFADLEDALKKGYLPWKELSKQFEHDFNEDKEIRGIIDKLKDIRINNEKNGLPWEEKDLVDIQNFKIHFQGFCINAVCEEFMDNYEEIMDGNYTSELLKARKVQGIEKAVRKSCIEYAYRNKEVLTLELVGKTVLNSLLDNFITAVLDENNYNNPRHESGKLYKLISTNFEFVQKLDENSKYHKDNNLSEYQRVQLVVDFISGMSDSYALNLHKKLMGVRLT